MSWYTECLKSDWPFTLLTQLGGNSSYSFPALKAHECPGYTLLGAALPVILGSSFGDCIKCPELLHTPWPWSLCSWFPLCFMLSPHFPVDHLFSLWSWLEHCLLEQVSTGYHPRPPVTIGLVILLCGLPQVSLSRCYPGPEPLVPVPVSFTGS